jgi:hypothetical protein
MSQVQALQAAEAAEGRREGWAGQTASGQVQHQEVALRSRQAAGM